MDLLVFMAAPILGMLLIVVAFWWTDNRARRRDQTRMAERIQRDLAAMKASHDYQRQVHH